MTREEMTAEGYAILVLKRLAAFFRGELERLPAGLGKIFQELNDGWKVPATPDAQPIRMLGPAADFFYDVYYDLGPFSMHLQLKQDPGHEGGWAHRGIMMLIMKETEFGAGAVGIEIDGAELISSPCPAEDGAEAVEVWAACRRSLREELLPILGADMEDRKAS